MEAFINEHFLLDTEVARQLYDSYAKNAPIADYHCHVSPKEIWEDRQFENLTQLWLGGDHYKWRMMRANGVDERYITGDASDWEKFYAFASALPKAIGNPMYHWCHLELKRYFGYRGALSAKTAKEVWDLANTKLAEGTLSVRQIIKMSNVAMIGTTDDPTDTLEYHEKIRKEGAMDTLVCPTFRPDKALNVDKAGWRAYIDTLSRATGVSIDSMESLKEALKRRMDHFDAMGCRASDHGLDYMVYKEASDVILDGVLAKALAGGSVNTTEAEALKTELLVFCAGEYAKRGWAMQLHFNCLRNPNSRAFATLGPDSGFDCIGPHDSTRTLSALLDRLYREDKLPRTVLYSLDGSDNAFLGSLIGAFQGTEVPGKLQHGSAWWFNDHKKGMTEQLESLANLSLLGNFIGMLTDSRSFLSYTRHEYFRRILCSLIGKWVENGEYPYDLDTLGGLVADICYGNAARYFGLK